MGFKTTGGKAANTQERVNLNLMAVGAAVTNARVIGDTCITFTLKCKGFALYNMKLCEGRDGYFIAPPSTKGKDGKYYNQYAVYLSQDDEQRMIEDVLKEAGVHPDDNA